jgi:tRNA-specific 2-thiouridylase
LTEFLQKPDFLLIYRYRNGPFWYGKEPMRVLIGMSGGFDSAYTAHLLRASGHVVEGAVLKMHAFTELEEARACAEALGIPLHEIDGTALFEEAVVTPFCEAYLAARTPNPCILCNERVKFKLLYDYANENGFDRIATGHYARVAQKNGRYAIEMAKDVTKDQSYMLYRLSEDILAKLILPMGDIIKKEAKREGVALSLAAAERAESQEICFVGEESYADFIERRYGVSPEGDFVSESGEVLGTHHGIIRYTVGQRKGLGVSAESRLFIARIDPVTNRIRLAKTPPDVRAFTLTSPVFSGLSREEALTERSLTVRVRYTATPVPATLDEVNGTLFCTLHGASRTAITAGQSAVFYLDGRVALGGIIAETL